MQTSQIPAVIVCLTSIYLSLGSCAFEQQPEVKSVTLNIASAITLKDPLIDIKQIYTKENPHLTINYHLASSGELEKKIEQGEKADIFISSSTKLMDALESQGKLLQGTRQNLLGNQIVLVATKESNVNNFQDLTTNKVKTVSLGNQETPVGQYSEEILKSLGVLDEIKPKIVVDKNARAVLNNVETGKADAGIVFMTDALQSSHIKVAAIAPEKLHTPIVYLLAILKDSQNQPEAKDFIKFIASDRGSAIFVKYGFTINQKNSRE